MADLYQLLPELQVDEMIFVSGLLKNVDEETARRFATVYRSRRKEPQTVLLMSLIGFVGIAGVHRFYLDQIGMGLLYLFTAGICFIGTIIDIINHKDLAFEYNQKKAQEVFYMIKGSA
ncbi:MAG: TM2 domain-containing protein [candidate division Zixibacteria bacterium]|nr:TM2 domain-containing protein [candidate division Zixibacteria bacterium]